jgi:hypothetical protein
VTRRIVTVPPHWRPQAKPGEPVKYRGRVPATEPARARRELPPDDWTKAEGPLRFTRRIHPVTGRLHVTFYCENGHVMKHKILGPRALDTQLGLDALYHWAAYNYLDMRDCRTCVRDGHQPRADQRERQNFIK